MWQYVKELDILHMGRVLFPVSEPLYSFRHEFVPLHVE